MRIMYGMSDVCSSDLIHALGTLVNPLDSVPLRSDLLFFDGYDPYQLAWALRVSPGAKLILTKGAPLELMKARQRRFYFDQDGKLIAHFGIRALDRKSTRLNSCH